MPHIEEHVILVAVQVSCGTEDNSRTQAMAQVMEALKEVGPLGPNNIYGIESWWIAEDDRIDGSDCDSAVFVNPGGQNQASRVLHDTVARNPHTGLQCDPTVALTQVHNIVTRRVCGWFYGGPI